MIKGQSDLRDMNTMRKGEGRWAGTSIDGRGDTQGRQAKSVRFPALQTGLRGPWPLASPVLNKNGEQGTRRKEAK